MTTDHDELASTSRTLETTTTAIDAVPTENRVWNILDIDQNVLMDIFSMLDVVDLSAVAGTCQYLNDIARSVFKQSKIDRIIYCAVDGYTACSDRRNMYIEVCFNEPVAAVAIEDDGPCCINNIDVFKRILRHFGDFLCDIDVRLTNAANTVADGDIFNLVIELCGNAVTKLSFTGHNDRAFDQPTVICPALTDLTVNSVIGDYSKIFFPALTAITVHGTCPDAFVCTTFDGFIQRHPQLRQIHVDASYIASGSAIANLMQLDQLIVHGFSDGVMSLRRLQHLRELKFIDAHEHCDHIHRFIRDLLARNSLQVVHLVPLDKVGDPVDFQDNICSLPALHELWIDAHNDLFCTGDDLARLHQLQELRHLTLVHLDELHLIDLEDLLTQLPHIKRIRIYVLVVNLNGDDCLILRAMCRPRNIRLQITFLHYSAQVPFYSMLFGEFVSYHTAIPNMPLAVLCSLRIE